MSADDVRKDAVIRHPKIRNTMNEQVEIEAAPFLERCHSDCARGVIAASPIRSVCVRLSLCHKVDSG